MVNNVQAPPRVLVVEDEILIQELIVQTLEEAGFSVQTTTSAEDAISLLEGAKDPGYQAVVTDIDLGNESAGWGVAHRARELHPEMPVVYVTGGGASEWSANGVPNSILVVKPFAPAQIVTAVTQLLNAAASGPAA